MSGAELPRDVGEHMRSEAAWIATQMLNIAPDEKQIFLESRALRFLQAYPGLEAVKLVFYLGLAIGSALERVETVSLPLSQGELFPGGRR
jgi:hypothetical protein